MRAVHLRPLPRRVNPQSPQAPQRKTKDSCGQNADAYA
jgi:hypothetical protein